MDASDVEPGVYLPGTPDGFERLWVPHRMAYVKGDHKTLENQTNCPFCVSQQTDEQFGLVVHKGKECFVVMNLYPYNSGHLLVCPLRHVADYTDLTDSERAELGELTSQAIAVSRLVMNPQGFNLGINQGAVAGAGVAAHLHQHVVPRWLGDANFFPIIAQTKALPQLLEDTRQRLAEAWRKEFTDAR